VSASRIGARTVLAVLAVGLAVTTVTPAGAAPRRIDVYRGPDALVRALDRARAGDGLRVHRGRYREAVTIGKRMTVKAVGPGRVVVVGGAGPPRSSMSRRTVSR